MASDKIKKQKKETEEKTELPKITETNNGMHTPHDHEIERKKQRLIWFGALCIFLLILVMWAWNAKILFYKLSEYKKTNAKKTSIIQDAKQDLETMLETFKKQNALEEATKTQAENQKIESAENSNLQSILKNIIEKK
jgi:hypothetical protein